MRSIIVNCICAAILQLAGWGVSYAQEIHMSYPGLTGESAPLWVAREAGFLKGYGLDAKLVYMEGGRLSIQSLLSNTTQFMTGDAVSALSAIAGGADIVLLASAKNVLPYVFAVSKDVRRGEDLKGKIIATSQVGGRAGEIARMVIRNMGLDPDKDVNYLAVSKGFRVLTDLHSANIKTLSSGVIVKGNSLHKERTLTTNLLQAVIEGLAFVKSPTQKSKVIRTLMERLKITDMAIAEQGYRYLQRDLDIGLYPAVEGLKNLQRFMRTYNPRVAEVNATDLVDDSLVRGLIDNGLSKRYFVDMGCSTKQVVEKLWLQAA